MKPDSAQHQRSGQSKESVVNSKTSFVTDVEGRKALGTHASGVLLPHALGPSAKEIEFASLALPR
jgi:hypothetical protein